MPPLAFIFVVVVVVVFVFVFYFIFKLYIIVLVLPNIKMNPPPLAFKLWKISPISPMF